MEKVGVKMEMKMKRRKEKKRELGVKPEEEAGEGEEGSSEDIAQDTLGGEDQEDLATKKVLLPLLVKRRVEKWRVMMEEEEGDVDAAVEVSEVAGDSVAVEDSVDLGSVVDIEEDVEDSEVIEEGSVVAAELGELEEDLGEEEEDSVEAMTEEKAALNSAICFAITSFQTTSSTTSSADFFSFSSSNNLLAGNSAFIANDQSYKSLVC